MTMTMMSVINDNNVIILFQDMDMWPTRFFTVDVHKTRYIFTEQVGTESLVRRVSDTFYECITSQTNKQNNIYRSCFFIKHFFFSSSAFKPWVVNLICILYSSSKTRRIVVSLNDVANIDQDHAARESK